MFRAPSKHVTTSLISERLIPKRKCRPPFVNSAQGHPLHLPTPSQTTRALLRVLFPSVCCYCSNRQQHFFLYKILSFAHCICLHTPATNSNSTGKLIIQVRFFRFRPSLKLLQQLQNHFLSFSKKHCKVSFKMAPRDNCFPSKLTVFKYINNFVKPAEDETDEEEQEEMQEQTVSSSEDENSEDIFTNETPVTSGNQNTIFRRLVFAARRLFPSETEENDESDCGVAYLRCTDDEND